MMNVAQDQAMRPLTMRKTPLLALENIDGLLDEAVENLAVACGVFAIVDGTQATGEVTGSDPEDRENFNIAVARASQALRCIRRELGELRQTASGETALSDDDDSLESGEHHTYDAEE